MKISPGVNQLDFQSAVSQWQKAVGDEWVFTSEADVDLYRDAYTPFRHEAQKIIPAVAPNSVESVQAVMRSASQYRIPIYPVSPGRNLDSGGQPCATAGFGMRRGKDGLRVEHRDNASFELPQRAAAE